MTKTAQAAWRTYITTQSAPALLALSLAAAGLSAHADTKVRTSSFEYNVQGLLTREVVEPDSPNNCLQTSYSFDAFGNRNQVSTSACAGASGATLLSASVARTSANNYGTDGRFPVSSSNALGQSETKVFDARFGVITSLTGPNLLNTTWAYDGFGRKTQETRADGTKTTWAYKLCTDSGANCPSSVGPATITWVVIEQSLGANLAASAPEKRQYYDTLNRVVRVQTQGFDGAGGAAPILVQDTEYNALGQVVRQSNTYVSTGTPVWTSYTYDALGRISIQSQPDSASAGGIATTTFTYNGLSSTVTNAKGQTKTTVKNAQGQVASVTDAVGSTITYTYDALGQLTQTNAAGSITTLEYNQRGQKIAMQDPAMGSWIYSYNAYGELVSQRDSLNQTTTLAYDVLGRMVKRTEPDLVSDWSYDTKFDGSSCGRSKGKLCEAKTDNNYKRTHSYDSLGRISSTATVLDNVASPALVSVAYDANTGRVANKTWPTGYQASYGYTALGYLKTVTGGGTNGFTATQSYQVLAMNAQGQITQYKTGNNVTTVSTYDLQTQRLKTQTATKDGQALGNVLTQSYNYDSLGNLLTRNDTSPDVGTQENFSYDSLNRLTLASILGGSVSPPTTTEVMYDPRGNITYKSDVGRYWYDAARPNRMTNVTLETAPGATVALSGTRALSYAFDDAQSGVQSVAGTTVGNGNLTYTVSRDTVNNRHTVRWESYTSFNMPAQITYGNFTANTTTCPAGYTLSNGSCTMSSNTAVPAAKVVTCTSGQVSSGSRCVQTPKLTVYSCPPDGPGLVGNRCVGWSYAQTIQQSQSAPPPSMDGAAPPEWGAPPDASAPPDGAPPPGEEPPAVEELLCPSGQRKSEEGPGYITCESYSDSPALPSKVCSPPARSISSTMCQTTVATSLPIGSNYCVQGTLSGNTCIVSATRSVPAGASNASDRTLTFLYGPEHQRIKQNVALSGNGTSAYFSGNTWYLNGEDSLGLTYEKEVRANGTTEHKHYLSAGGMTIALFTSRTGTLNGLPATTTSYFHKDQLGSISAITDETGVVTERLAYDPWGKRRFINITPGQPDNLDAIVGIKTDRGYTEHEHLDEVGVIHMNGRIYDPLMGRFMSADPYVQAPDYLQNYNRYSYVVNNPLTLTDPSGYWFHWAVAAVAAVWASTTTNKEDKQAATWIASIAVSYGAGPAGGWRNVYAAGAAGGAAGAATGAALNGGNLEQVAGAAARGALSGAMFAWAGGQGGAPDTFARYAAHAGAGCVSAVAGGGNCGSGAVSAVFGKFATNLTDGKGFEVEFTAAVISGGVGSVIAGGKFENGATTAAYGYLFNQAMSNIARHQAFAEARRAAGIPASAVPEVTYDKLYDGNKSDPRYILDNKGKPIEGRVYRYEVNGRTITIQEHSIGHMQKDANGKWVLQEKGHFNVRGSENLNAKPHYYFNSKITDVVRYWSTRNSSILVSRGTQD